MTAALRFTTTDAQGIVSRLYGVEGDVSALPGNYDQNFVVTSVAGPLFVLKGAGLGEREDVLDLQHRAMQCLAAGDVGVDVPSVIPAGDGTLISAVDGRLVRLLSFVDGAAWSSLGAVTSHHLHTLGRLVGSVGAALTASHSRRWTGRTRGS